MNHDDEPRYQLTGLGMAATDHIIAVPLNTSDLPVQDAAELAAVETVGDCIWAGGWSR